MRESSHHSKAAPATVISTDFINRFSPETDLNDIFSGTEGTFSEEIMKKNNITTALLALGLATSSPFTFANTNGEEIDDTLLVTANRSAQSQFTALSANSIITNSQIKALQANNINELLDKVAGVSVVQQGGAGQNSSVFIRGANSNHTLILIDGVRVNSATLGATKLSTISPNQIDRIEIVKGPRAALWGSDAIGGVIQIFSKRLHTDEGNVSLGFGSNGLLQGDAAIGFGNDAHNMTVSISSESADGFNAYSTDPFPYDINEDDIDGYERNTINILGHSTINENAYLELIGRYEDANNEYDASYPDSPCWDDPSKVCPSFYANEEDSENYSVKLTSVYEIDNIYTQVSLATVQDKAETYGNGIAKSAADEIKTERDQASINGQYSFSEQTRLNVGFDFYNEKVSTNTDKDAWTPGFQAWSDDERDVKAFFAQAQTQMAAFLFEAAARYDDVENADENTSYNASVGYQPNSQWLISFTHGTGFKAPTFNDLYWPGSGNPDLEPEEIDNNEILIRHRFEQGQVELTWFDSSIDNLIAWAPNDMGVWQPDNINSADISGIEATVQVTLFGLNNTLAMTYLDTEDKTSGDELFNRPKLSANYHVSYDWHNFSLGGDITYRDESQDSAFVTLDSYTLLDLNVAYQAAANLRLNVKANNVFDEDYETSANYLADGRNFKASLNYQF